MDQLRKAALRVIEAWDETVLPKARDGMMQERMEALREALTEPAELEPLTDEQVDRVGAPELLGALRMLLATAGEINDAPDGLLEMALDSDDLETRNQANAHLCARATIAAYERKNGIAKE